MTPIYGLVGNFNTGEDMYNLSEKLEDNYDIHGNLASNNYLIELDQIAFYTKSRSYGLPKKNESYNELKNELEDNNIDYYLVWGESKENNYLSNDFKEITNGSIKNLRIYSLKS